ncbi:MAG: glycosyltransferase family 39 protein [Candidatus Aquilonibacter sp.]
MISSRWFWLVVGLAVVLGTFFRVEHIERRLFWTDESWTALRVSGHTYVEVRHLFDGRVHTNVDVTRFQQADPYRNLSATVSGLAAEEPQHPPVFYVLDHVWALMFGSAIPALRSPALLFSIAAIAGAYWFVAELSGSAIAAGAAAAIMAVSPFFVNYGGQAREYSLWTMAVCVTSALLLRALRRRTALSWVWYALAMAVSLYSALFMISVLAAHALYVIVEKRQDHRSIAAFAIAAVVAFASFVPWLLVCVHGTHAIWAEQQWTRIPYQLTAFISKWAFNTDTVLFDAEYADMRLLPIAAVMLFVILYSAFRLIRDESFRTWRLLVLLSAAIVLPQILLDLATRGHSSTESRYMIPLWLSLLVAVALLFGRALSRSRTGVAALPFAALCAVLAVATFSSARNSTAVVWWDNDDDYPSTAMAAEIDASGPRPLVVSEGHWAEVLVMSHYLSPDARLLLFKGTPPFPLPIARRTFLLAPSARTLAAFAREPQYALTAAALAPPGSEALLAFRAAVRKRRPGATDDEAPGEFLYRIQARVARR